MKMIQNLNLFYVYQISLRPSSELYSRYLHGTMRSNASHICSHLQTVSCPLWSAFQLCGLCGRLAVLTRNLICKRNDMMEADHDPYSTCTASGNILSRRTRLKIGSFSLIQYANLWLVIIQDCGAMFGNRTIMKKMV